MEKRRSSGIGVYLAVWLLLMVSATAGCSLGEAIVDGVFGGITDAVAALVSQTTLGTVSSSSP
jgi:hypothetical protein